MSATTLAPTAAFSDIMTTTLPLALNEIISTTIIPEDVTAITTTIPAVTATTATKTTTAVPVSPQEAILAPLINTFSIRLTESLAKRSNDSNIFVSPFSVSTILSILLLGARSSSAQQLKHGLEFDSIDSENADPLLVHSYFQQLLEHNGLKKQLLLSNLLYSNRPENTTINATAVSHFKTRAEKYYGAKLSEADFGSQGVRVMEEINGWVNESTKGLIDGILSGPPDVSSKVILLNAIYFKGRWARPFNKDITKKSEFYNQGTRNITTDFMSAYGQDYKHALITGVGGTEAVDVIEIPYEGSAKSMVLLLPRKRDGLSRFLTSSSVVQDITTAIREVSKAHEIPVNIEIPKFRLETEYELNTDLIGMGISDIFEAGKADLSGIDGTQDLYVSLVKHKAVVDVNEEGTEAAAVTSVEVKVLSFIQPINFYADHPFMFLIRDTGSGLILFIGKIENL